MTDEQIKHMVNRFLGWKLPTAFNPDAGISFKATFNEHTAHPMRHEPIGTNLFDTTQADAMVRYMVEGMPGDASGDRAARIENHRQTLRKFQRHWLLRQYGDDGLVLPENLEVSAALDAVISEATG